MSWLPALAALVALAVAAHPVVGLVLPSAREAWSTTWLLVWVAWATVGVPGVLTVWSRHLDGREFARLVKELAAWRERGEVVDAQLGLLIRQLVEQGRAPLVLSLLEALEPRRAADAGLEALCVAVRAWLAAAGYGSGAFQGDGWASLGLQERVEAVRVAARALERR